MRACAPTFSRGVERLARFRRMDLNHVYTADTIKLVSASTPTYVCALAYACRFEMPLKIVGFRRLFESPYCETRTATHRLPRLQIICRSLGAADCTKVKAKSRSRWRRVGARPMQRCSRPWRVFTAPVFKSSQALMMSSPFSGELESYVKAGIPANGVLRIASGTHITRRNCTANLA